MPDDGYIEFMEEAFRNAADSYIHRLIIHEKAHFLWAHLFDERLRQDWIELGGWYRNDRASSGWSTTNQTAFVSYYAHDVNPNEDMAESIAHFLVNPDRLRSRAPAKYEFIRDRIMQGSVYLSRIREGPHVRSLQPLSGLRVSRKDPPRRHPCRRSPGRG